MNNLLRTLTQSSVKPALQEGDFRLLLTAVKDSRRTQGEKLADEFHDALENLLLDLRTVTPDNHDAEPFLNRVSKAEAPDYYDIIQHPMDLGTMLRRVKGKHYRSKREFKDDLDLIWNNCFTYNHAPDHPIRAKAGRLKVKAETLLAAITDKRERTDPYIPLSLTHVVSSPGSLPDTPNVVVNGNVPHINGKSMVKSKLPSSLSLSRKSTSTNIPKVTPQAPQDLAFPDTLAAIRTPEGMAAFLSLDADFSAAFPEPTIAIAGPGPSSMANLEERLRSYLPPLPSSSETTSEVDGPGTEEEELSPADDDLPIGGKRKLNGDARPRKRSRLRTVSGIGILDKTSDPVELWWAAASSPSLLANGVPAIPYASGSAPGPRLSLPGISISASGPSASPRKRRKEKEHKASRHGSLLAVMSDNIRTMKRVRRAHARLAALADEANAADGAADEPLMPGPPLPSAGAGLGVAPDTDATDTVDDTPWRPRGMEGRKRTRHVHGAEADDCLRWMSGRVVEHAGFQGSSKVALDVLGSVVGEYLGNVGRTMRFMEDKYAGVMTPEEMILHTLFESGITEVQDLERYIQEDVVRYGTRMGELEKKLKTAYTDTVMALAGETLDDDTLFADRPGDEEEGAFVMGGAFADAYGEDFLGLKALGIADEFGLSSLSVPRKLLRAKKARADAAAAEKQKAEQELLPYPPPPPFVPLKGDTVGKQIGLLRPFLEQRFAVLATQAAIPPPPPPPPGPFLGAPTLQGPPPLVGPSILPGPPVLTGPPALSGPILNGLPAAPATAAPPPQPIPAPAPTPAPAATPEPITVDPASLILEDELPLPSRCKLGSLGQVIKPGQAGGGTKKKASGGAKDKDLGSGSGGSGSKDAKTGKGKEDVKKEGSVAPSEAGTVGTANESPTKKGTGRPPGRPPLPEGQKKKKGGGGGKKKGGAAGVGPTGAGGSEGQKAPAMVAASA